VRRRSRAPRSAGCRAPTLLAILLALPALLPAQGEPLHILGFRREPSPSGIELVLACSGPVSFRYSSPSLETIRLVLPGLDPSGVTPPREAWGQDLIDVELAPATGDEAPGALLELTLPAFRPYSIRAVDNELRITLEDGSGVTGTTPSPVPAHPLPTPEPRPEPAVEVPPAVPAEPEATHETAAAPERVARETEAALVAEDLPGPVSAASPEAEAPEPLPVPGTEVAGTPAPEPSGAAGAPAPMEPDFFEGTAPDPPPFAAEPEVTDADSESDTPAATRIFEVESAELDGTLAIRIPANGRPSYQAFFTQEGPLRLVIDFDGAESRPLFQRLDVGVGPVRRVRVGQHEAEPVPIVRVVIDLDERVSHRIETDALGLTIRFDGLAIEP
jgi:hypothetical protein